MWSWHWAYPEQNLLMITACQEPAEGIRHVTTPMPAFRRNFFRLGPFSRVYKNTLFRSRWLFLLSCLCTEIQYTVRRDWGESWSLGPRQNHRFGNAARTTHQPQPPASLRGPAHLGGCCCRWGWPSSTGLWGGGGAAGGGRRPNRAELCAPTSSGWRWGWH